MTQNESGMKAPAAHHGNDVLACLRTMRADGGIRMHGVHAKEVCARHQRPAPLQELSAAAIL